MSKCKYCGVQVLDTTESCPLCHGGLDLDENVREYYPDVTKNVKKIVVARRIIWFLCLLISGLLMFIEYLNHDLIHNSLIVVVALIYGAFLFSLMSSETADYRRRTLGTVFGCAAYVAFVDYMLGFKGWSLDYVFPSAIIFIDVGLIVLIIVNRRNWASYMILQLLMILVGIIMIVFIAKGIIRHPLFAEITIFINIFSFLGTLILGGQTARIELKRRFHL